MKYFKECMEEIISDSRNGMQSEKLSDEFIAIATRHEMEKRLSEARVKGRHGWWDKDVCTIEQLYAMRSMALLSDDHISVINFTAMIAARESVENK